MINGEYIKFVLYMQIGFIDRSSNGRTEGFDPSYIGSNPILSANPKVKNTNSILYYLMFIPI